MIISILEIFMFKAGKGKQDRMNSEAISKKHLMKKED